MQSQKMPWSAVSRCLGDLVRSQGVLGLWNGYTATLLRDVPFSALYWPLYEHTKYLLNSYSTSANIVVFYNHNFIINFLSGAVAGSVASTVTLPFDVIKTLKQIELGEKDIMKTKPGKTCQRGSCAWFSSRCGGPRSCWRQQCSAIKIQQ